VQLTNKKKEVLLPLVKFIYKFNIFGFGDLDIPYLDFFSSSLVSYFACAGSF
jgi:hypothetical protein